MLYRLRLRIPDRYGNRLNIHLRRRLFRCRQPAGFQPMGRSDRAGHPFYHIPMDLRWLHHSVILAPDRALD